MTGLSVGAEGLTRAALALVAVLVLLAMGLWLLQRHGGAPMRRLKPGARLAVTSSIALDSRVRLVLVRRDGAEHLLAIGPGGVCLLESSPARIEPTADTAAAE